MSNSLFLVEYEQTPDGKLIEETAHIIQSAFIDQRLLEQLENDWGFNTTPIHEEEGSEETIEIRHLDDKKIHEVYDYFFDAFKKLIIKANDRLKAFAKDNALTTQESNQKREFDFNDVEQFRVLTNLIAILKIKIEQYNGSNTVFLKVG
ncbi:hypothetical protein ABFV67_02865 [Vibrio metschnikovii]|uniref:hypothetical protein n=1 Tax=Vibrio metschnikovii TaxID=28172 RepID=UPI0032EA9F73|nr:hypothetical protein [Vibrio cholerae]EKO3776620.1 hypothetical protein [Vibrio metschnikovii]